VFETRNPPLRPPLRPAEPDLPKPASLSKTARYARRVHLVQADRKQSVSEAFAAAKEATQGSATEIRRRFGWNLPARKL
jgi:hypothetical protein